MNPNLDPTDNSAIQQLIDLGTTLGDAKLVQGDYVVIPKDYKIESLERFKTNPDLKKGRINVVAANSFTQYFSSHFEEGRSTIYATIDQGASKFKVFCVIDDHYAVPGIYSAGWRQHIVIYTPTRSKEFADWTEKDGVKMSQEDFADFIEDHIDDFNSVDGKFPTGGEMATMATNFQMTSEKVFKRKIDNTTCGAQLEFVDKADGATAAMIDTHKRFCVAIPVFDDDTVSYRIEARLRFRAESGKVVFWFDLVRKDLAFKYAALAKLAKIEEVTNVTPMMVSDLVV